jgi:YhcH/YjgK/YiaL family protein
VRLEPGVFALFMPGDAHMPMIRVPEAPGEITKVVIKVDAALIGKGILD